jgi:alpha-ketoglutarate-dependent taurine dioxygenase
MATTSQTTSVSLQNDHLIVADGRSRFHYVWLRDNCWCDECRVVQSGERRLVTASIPDDIAAVDASTDDSTLTVQWSDGHTSRYTLDWLTDHDYSSAPVGAEPRRTLWDASIDEIPRFAHDKVVGDPHTQIAYLEAVREFGAAVVTGVPSEDHEVERFADTIGHVRETAFERVHNVRNDPTGYNVAHTALELKPHSDMPSYHWPPSIQLLHFLVNDANGGESTLVDGWRVLADLRAATPDAFDILTRVPVTFQLFSADEDTRATAPIVQLDPLGRVTTFRFSNQLALPVRAEFDDIQRFYDAYRTLGRMLDSPTYKHAFATATGDLLTVHGHRVLHGRMAFDPESGARHLQDVYMEYDDLMARLAVLSGTHRPTPSDGRTLT